MALHQHYLTKSHKKSLLNSRLFYDPYGTRTRVTAVKGRCLNRLTNGPGKFATESKGFEPLRQFGTIYMISNHAPSASRTTLQSERSSILFLKMRTPAVGLEPTTS